jgi:hypothetical protein
MVPEPDQQMSYPNWNLFFAMKNQELMKSAHWILLSPLPLDRDSAMALPV